MGSKLCQSSVVAIRVFATAGKKARTGIFAPQQSTRLASAHSHLGELVQLRYSSSTKMEGAIVHDRENSVFFVQLSNNGGKAVLEYERINSGTLDFYHTGVPVSHRGQGIAKHLVKAGFDYAISEKLMVKPTCSYVLKYVNEHLDEVGIKNNTLMS